MPAEMPVYMVACALYGAATVTALMAFWNKLEGYKWPLYLLGAALLVNTVSIGIRWDRIDHGPYVNLQETLTSSVWGYNLALFLAAAFIGRIRPILALVLPVMMILVAWSLYVENIDSKLPVTYDTIWLPIHILLGKVFIGCVIVAMGLGFVVFVRWLLSKRGVAADARFQFGGMPDDEALDELSFRFMFIGFIFETLMLITGAIWAQDAWGRYWAWDPLETWSFMTWISVAVYLHLRITKRPPPVVGAALVTVAFILGFLTYFGLPFISDAAHQGVV